jgi:hypothetical protein
VFIPLTRSPEAEAGPAPREPFDPSILDACLRQLPAWKRQHGFPEDVSALLAPDASAADWKRVMIVRPIALPLVLITTGTEGGRVLGFPFEPGPPQPGEPILALDGANVSFPELRDDPPLSAWEAAWREAGHAPALDLQRHDAWTLRVSSAEALGDVWLLAGNGSFRCAARVERPV